jgi:hypothetical protein
MGIRPNMTLWAGAVQPGAEGIFRLVALGAIPGPSNGPPVPPIQPAGGTNGEDQVFNYPDGTQVRWFDRGTYRGYVWKKWLNGRIQFGGEVWR